MKRLTEGLKATKRSEDNELYKLFTNIMPIFPPKVVIYLTHSDIFKHQRYSSYVHVYIDLCCVLAGFCFDVIMLIGTIPQKM